VPTPAPSPVEHFDVRPMPVDAESAMPRTDQTESTVGQPDVAAEERPRRRSTVREPAPFAVENVAAPAAAAIEPAAAEAPHLVTSTPEPVGAETATAESPAAMEEARPRRTGWWARKLMGKG
jgi:ribonuclease E